MAKKCHGCHTLTRRPPTKMRARGRIRAEATLIDKFSAGQQGAGLSETPSDRRPCCARHLMAAQDQAKSRISSAIALSGGMQSKLRAGKEFNALEKLAAGRIDAVLGKGASANTTVLGNLQGAAKSMLGVLQGSKPINLDSSIRGRANASVFTRLSVSQRFFSQSLSDQAQSLAHEAHHHGQNSNDYPGIDRDTGLTISAYGLSNAARRSELKQNPDFMLTQPDPTTFALGFTMDAP
jgi:hypothetical protein